MAQRMALVQTRVNEREVRRIDHDIAVLGLHSRSEAVREGLRLLHQRARHVNLAKEYDAFYGGSQAPVSGTTAAGDHIATDAMLENGNDC